MDVGTGTGTYSKRTNIDLSYKGWEIMERQYQSRQEGTRQIKKKEFRSTEVKIKMAKRLTL